MKALISPAVPPKVIGMRPRSESNFKAASAIAINTQEGFHVVPVEDIVRVEADGNYCRVYLAQGRAITVSKTLKTVADVLPAIHFVRIHASHMVRLSAVRDVTKDRVVLSDGTCLPIARSRRAHLLNRISAFATIL